jgi:DNA (cytosine-5)-methyltransferase 1
MQSREPVCYQDVVGTLSASDYKFPQQQQIHEDKAIVERVTFGNNSFGGWDEKPATLTVKGEVVPGGKNLVVENRYVVRRLTPQECAMLQGFQFDYCSGLETPEPTEEDIVFWSEVFETHRKIMGTSTKPKSRKQIIKWLQDPYSDSAEYKLWGNGVTLNVVVFIMGGIVWAAGAGDASV